MIGGWCGSAGLGHYVFKEGSDWNALPLALGCGSGATCWRRFRAWQTAGVWPRLHRLLLARLQAVS